MKNAQHQNASGGSVVVYGMRNALTAPQAAPDEAVVCAETWVVCRDGHFLIEGCCITLRLGVAEVLNAVQVDVDQVAFGVEREFNLRHATSLFVGPLHALPVALHLPIGH